MRRRLRGVLCTLIMSMMLAAIFCPLQQTEADAAAKTGVRTGWVDTRGAYTYLARYRKAKKVKALKRSRSLEKVARIRAKEMARHRKFSHTRPNGRSGLSIIPGRGWKGENIAMGQRSCAEVSICWYRSKGHRANMLRKGFRKVGIACYRYKGINYWVQVFSG